MYGYEKCIAEAIHQYSFPPFVVSFESRKEITGLCDFSFVSFFPDNRIYPCPVNPASSDLIKKISPTVHRPM